jgi:hypothetical protein
MFLLARSSGCNFNPREVSGRVAMINLQSAAREGHVRTEESAT